MSEPFATTYSMTTFTGSIKILPRLSDMLVNYCNSVFTCDSSADPIASTLDTPIQLELDSLRSICRPSEVPLKPLAAPCSGFDVTPQNHTGGCCGSLDHLDCHHILPRSSSGFYQLCQRSRSTHLEIGQQKPCRAADFSFWLQYLIDFIGCVAELVEKADIKYSGDIEWNCDNWDIGRMNIEPRKHYEATRLRPGEIKAFLHQLSERKVNLPFRRLDEFRPFHQDLYLSKYMVVVNILDLKFAGPYLSPEVAPELHQAGYIHLLCSSIAVGPCMSMGCRHWTISDLCTHSGSIQPYRLEVHAVKSSVHPQDARPKHPSSAVYTSEGHVFLRSFIENYDERVATTYIELDKRYGVKNHLPSLQVLALNQALQKDSLSTTKLLPGTIANWLHHQIARHCSTCGTLFFAQTKWTTVWQYVEGTSNIFAYGVYCSQECHERDSSRKMQTSSVVASINSTPSVTCREKLKRIKTSSISEEFCKDKFQSSIVRKRSFNNTIDNSYLNCKKRSIRESHWEI